jgi:hypothetical protein
MQRTQGQPAALLPFETWTISGYPDSGKILHPVHII